MKSRREFAVWLTYEEMLGIRLALHALDNKEPVENKALELIEKRIKDLEDFPN